MAAVSAWGRLSSLPHTLIPLANRHDLISSLNQTGLGLAHGMGRSYGDVCLNPYGVLWQTTSLDRFIQFDANTGILECESGVLLRDIQNMSVARGWMLPVTPGTQLITVGGAIANDVHGKNHHRLGTFGNHVRALTLARTDGQFLECNHNQNGDWFAATVGGLGLTGVITKATLQLRRVAGAWLDTETLPYSNLSEFFQLADLSERDWEHTVSWIDCVSGRGRGIFMRGNPTEQLGEAFPTRPLHSMPFVPPISLVNSLSLRAFNFSYFQLKKKQAGHKLMHYIPFSYPLDNLLAWNKMYGPKGFYQYQSVVPRAVGQEAIHAMLQEISRSGEGSFLAVLKTFGDNPAVGMLSFPQQGVTLALDFPNHGVRTEALFARLDAIVREAKGRIYPAKDARMPRELFEAGYLRLNEFLPYRDEGISSALSRRLMGS